MSEEEILTEQEHRQGHKIKCLLIEGSDSFIEGYLFTKGIINLGELLAGELPETRSEVYIFTEGPDAKTIRPGKMPGSVYIVTEGVSGINVLRVDRYGEVIDGLSSQAARELKGRLLDNGDLRQQVVAIGGNLPAGLGNTAQKGS